MILAGLSALCYERKADETLPVVVFLLMLITYSAGILGIIRHIPEILILALISGNIFFFILIIRKEHISFPEFFKKLVQVYLCEGFFLFLILSAVIVFLYRNMSVLNWDDLNYWALFPRNMYEINGVPTGRMSSSIFRDYHPLIQYLYYVIFRFTGHFSEPLMFAANNTLMLLGLSPFFRRLPGRSGLNYALSVCFGILFPYLCMRQMLYCLGVDDIMTCLFGYGIVSICDEKKDLFYFARLSSVSAVLVLTKQTGIFPAAIILLLIYVNTVKKIGFPFLKTLLTSLPSILAAVSWKLFCMIKGNTSYLGDRLSGNISGQRSTVFPPYAVKTVNKFIRQFFFFHLNDGILGITPFLILILFLAASYLYHKKCRQEKAVRVSFLMITAGFVIYLIMLVYVYLFIFDEWEALSLSSYDRYITVYAGALLYIALMLVLKMTDLSTRTSKVLAALLLSAGIISINYPFIITCWDQTSFKTANADSLSDKRAAEEEFAGWPGKNLPFGEKVLIIDNEPIASKRLFSAYAAVPAVTDPLSLSEAGKEGDSAKYILERCRDDEAAYVYFRSDCDPEETEPGKLFRYDSKQDLLIPVP